MSSLQIFRMTPQDKQFTVTDNFEIYEVLDNFANKTIKHRKKKQQKLVTVLCEMALN